MDKTIKSAIKFLIIAALIVAAGFIAYKIYQYVMMYVIGKAIVGTSSQMVQGISNFKD